MESIAFQRHDGMACKQHVSAVADILDAGFLLHGYRAAGSLDVAYLDRVGPGPLG